MHCLQVLRKRVGLVDACVLSMSMRRSLSKAPRATYVVDVPLAFQQES